MTSVTNGVSQKLKRYKYCTIYIIDDTTTKVIGLKIWQERIIEFASKWIPGNTVLLINDALIDKNQFTKKWNVITIHIDTIHIEKIYEQEFIKNDEINEILEKKITFHEAGTTCKDTMMKLFLIHQANRNVAGSKKNDDDNNGKKENDDKKKKIFFTYALIDKRSLDFIDSFQNRLLDQKFFFFYLIKYIGVTTNLNRRYNQHVRSKKLGDQKIIMILLSESNNEFHSKFKESLLIKHYGKRINLFNNMHSCDIIKYIYWNL